MYEPRTLEGSFTTYFKNIEIVPPGSFLKINLQNLEIKKAKFLIPESVDDLNKFAYKLGYPDKEIVVKPNNFRSLEGIALLHVRGLKAIEYSRPNSYYVSH